MGQAISIDQVFVLDFVNETQEIQSAFQPYYQATILSEATDPNKLYDLKRLLEEFHLFTSSIDTNFDIYQKISDDIELGNMFRQAMFNNFQKYLSDRRDQNLG